LAKVKKTYFCIECGYNSPKWEGKCPSCQSWNTFNEEVIHKPTLEEQRKELWKEGGQKNQPRYLGEIVPGSTLRKDTQSVELNRVLGGGLVDGSLILIGGEPGIGKSTLMLQICLNWPEKVLYISGEESYEQIRMRADRLNISSAHCQIYTETLTSKIFKAVKREKPSLVVVDSIQTVSSPYLDSGPGSVSQIRDCTSEFQKFAKETNTPVIIIGHITKEGSIAGPKILEHIVDVVLNFEGDQNHAYRILRTLKNRFGSTDEIGIYSMDSGGLREVSNPSELLISQNEEDFSGSAIAASIEGRRPILIEAQALVTQSVFGTPQRSATGFDLRRLGMLLAVLEKRCGLPFGSKDVFLNIVGGIKVFDPAIDLAIVVALISSLQDITIGKKICFAAEIGLSGELRGVSRIDQRIQEAQRLGFETIYISTVNAKTVKQISYTIEVKGLNKIEDLLYEVFG
jgi:DNA repair protein RadA/Sms